MFLLQERLRQRSLHVQDKTTYATKINFKTASMIHPADSDSDGMEQDVDDGKSVAVKDDPEFTLAVTRGISLISLHFFYYINHDEICLLPVYLYCRSTC